MVGTVFIFCLPKVTKEGMSFLLTEMDWRVLQWTLIETATIFQDRFRNSLRNLKRPEAQTHQSLRRMSLVPRNIVAVSIM